MARRTSDERPENQTNGGASSERDGIVLRFQTAEIERTLTDLDQSLLDSGQAPSAHLTADAHLAAADARDTIAAARDATAQVRDLAADERSLAMAALDESAQQDDDKRALTGTDVIMRAARARKHAGQRRTKATQQRELAAQDRLLAAADRMNAAGERLHAFADRKVLVAELEREQEHRRVALHYQRRAEELARTLQRSLSPPALPRITGLDVAVHYEPSAPEEVGGDFYDLFPLAAGRTGFFLGDVCGKGPQAAALTSLARYTMRTAAMLHETPDAILLDLNAALLMDTSVEVSTCTVVYGEIDADPRATTITLAVAGHPAPLIVRGEGAVETTPAHGTLLGIVADPVFHTCRIELECGDSVVICSDGILDTEIDAVRIDEQDVARLLRGAPHVSAQALVDRLIYALRLNDRPLRDDVAIMVVRRTLL